QSSARTLDPWLRKSSRVQPAPKCWNPAAWGTTARARSESRRAALRTRPSLLTRPREAAAAHFGRHSKEVGSRSRIVFAIVAAALAPASAAAAAGSWPKLERSAADQALADRSILHLTDFAPGSGWSPAPTPSSGNLHDPACAGRAFSDEGRVLTG